VAKSKNERLVTQSLTDRLTNYEDWPATRSASLRMYREGIKRDVEWLLNSRRPLVTAVDKYELASVSVFNFGLPDLTALRGHDSNAVLMAILQALRTYEPRISEPRVVVVRSDTLARSMRFHVDGVLAFEEGEEEISFDTVMEMISGEYEVK
jgi:type VI secretion system protein ImpF